MDDFLASVNIDNERSIHIACLARQTIIDAGAEHLGFDGYFLFEADENPVRKGISILGKVASLDAAFRMIDIWQGSIGRSDVMKRKPLADWEDSEAQLVYELLCDNEEFPPNAGEHWEGYMARRIVAELRKLKSK